MIIYSILRGTKGDGREVRSIVPSKHFSFFYHPFSFFLLPFFHKSRPQSGYRNRLETDEIPRVSATSDEFSSFTLPSRQYTRYTVNNIGPDGGHWNVFSGPAFKRRKWKPVQIAAMKARSLQNVGECRERGYCALSAIVQGWYWWAHLIGCVTHGYV